MGPTAFVEVQNQTDYDMTDSSIIIALPRVGKDGKIIRVYKFRTMCPGAQHMQALVYATCGLDVCGKFKDDPRITPIGKILRRYWLDEIPMILNVLNGDMKLFGVRPISEQYLSLYNDEVSQRRIKYKPGLIPPYYADMPKGLDEIQESEMRYFDAYDRSPVLTDLRYLIRIIVNVLVRATRSR
jgi:lipopolysaccharide/colanic/teichoic acid biosynthesis glycosyltransferase